MISPDPAPAPSGRSIKLPLAALAIEGTAPAPGDRVSFTVEGTISAASGDEGDILIETVNGEPVAGAAMPEDEDAALMRAALEADAENGV